MTQLNLSQLPPEKKRFAWQWLQENRPELAALLSQDDVRVAQEAFSAAVIIELEPSEIADMKRKFALVRPESV